MLHEGTGRAPSPDLAYDCFVLFFYSQGLVARSTVLTGHLVSFSKYTRSNFLSSKNRVNDLIPKWFSHKVYYIHEEGTSLN